MSSIRSRLAVGYAVTLLLTLGGFCAAVYYELRKPSMIMSGLDAQLASERDLAVQYLSESHRVLGEPRAAGRVARPDGRTWPPAFRACATTSWWSIPRAASCTPPIPSPRSRSPTCRPSARQLQPPPLSTRSVSLRLQSGRELRAIISPLETAGEPISALLVAAPIDRSVPDASVFLRSMLLVAPLGRSRVGIRRLLAFRQRAATGAGHHR